MRAAQVFLATALVASLELGGGHVAIARPAPAQPFGSDSATEQAAAQQARKLYEDGVKALKKHDTQAAYDAFHKAWALRPHPQIAASLGLAEIDLGRFRDAAEHLAIGLTAPPDAPEMRQELERKFAEAKSHVATLNITAQPAGSEILVNGGVVGRSPQAVPFFVEPGELNVEARHEGLAPMKKTVSATAGSSTDLAFVLRFGDSNPAAPPTKAPERPTAETSGRSVVPVVVGGVLVIAGVALGVGAMIAANGKASDAQSQRDALGAQSTPQQVSSSSECRAPSPALADQCSALTSAVSSRGTAKNLSVAGFAGAGVAAVATVAYLAFWPGSKPQAATVAWTPRLQPTGSANGGGVLFSGSF